MTLPEWAALGTVAMRPALVERRRLEGEVRVTRAPGLPGNARTIPERTLIPLTSSVPCVETWWGLVLQWATGTQLTPVILTLRTCGPCDFAAVLGVAAVVGSAPTAVPPGPAARAGAPHGPSRVSADAARAAATDAVNLL